MLYVYICTVCINNNTLEFGTGTTRQPEATKKKKSLLSVALTVKVYNMYALELGKTGFLRTLGMSCTLH